MGKKTKTKTSHMWHSALDPKIEKGLQWEDW